MGFTDHPFRMATVVNPKVEPPAIRCDNCGGEFEITMDMTVREVLKVQGDHVRNSHKMTEEQVEDWYV